MSEFQRNNNYSSHLKKRRKRRRRAYLHMLLLYIVLVLIIAAIAFGVYRLIKMFSARSSREPVLTPSTEITETVAQSTETTVAEETQILELIAQADRLALSYDYDAAIELLSQDPSFSSAPEVTAAIAGYEESKTKLEKKDVTKVPHVFFHSLIYDTTKAFDGDEDQMGYNQVMTTIGEFEKMLESMYERGFVLVRMHDMGYETTDEETGKITMKKGEILLPPDKKPIVFSQDDVCYYEYMTGDGFASRLVIGEDGRPTTEMDLADGSSVIGEYDMIPILNRFIDEHPDFSYRGAKAVIAVTGYQGVFGYRTAASYADKNPNYEADQAKVREIAQALRDDGWELASHSWGHLHLGRIDFDRFTHDCDKWDHEVRTLLGPVDIILYPFGTDVADWHPYTFENERYKYLYDLGFRYFCTVDSAESWVQFGDTNLRQGRRNLDGYRMKRDLDEPDKAKLSDLFDVKEIYDFNRPKEMNPIQS